MTLESKITRRHFITGTTVCGLFSMRTSSGAAAESAAASPALFDARSTAEEVTRDLDLTGKTALITGCSSGIGLETLRVLALRGAHVYGLASTLKKAQEACAQVTGTGIKGSATAFECDHTDFASVADCANAVRRRRTPLDMLICNAGVILLPHLELAEGYEKHFVVNHLGHFILVSRLLDRVTSARQGRIVVVSSGPNGPPGDIDFEGLTGLHGYEPGRMYMQSKLANALFSWELAHRLAGTRATSNALHPGIVKTDTARKIWARAGQEPPQADLKSPQQGAATSCYVATHPALEKVNGGYFTDCKRVVPAGHAQDDALAAKLWAFSEKITRPYLPQNLSVAGTFPVRGA